MSNPNLGLASLLNDISTISAKHDVDYSVLHDDTETRSEIENEDTELLLTEDDIYGQQQLTDDLESSQGNY
jgi:hypothetical protein